MWVFEAEISGGREAIRVRATGAAALGAGDSVRGRTVHQRYMAEYMPNVLHSPNPGAGCLSANAVVNAGQKSKEGSGSR